MEGSDIPNSTQLMNRAAQYIPGGVSSPARRFDPTVCLERGNGSRVVDLDGNEYVDFVNGLGTVILGHSDESIAAAITDHSVSHSLFGFGTSDMEVAVAKQIVDHVPAAERVVFGSTGSEVIAHAIQLARARTGAKKIIKFQGVYHGRYESIALNYRTNEENLGQRAPLSAGYHEGSYGQSVVLPFNDKVAVAEAVDIHGDELAAVVLEPVCHSMGIVTPHEGYLAFLRNITRENNILLIFDETISGFRHDLGGAQRLFGITPDISIMGKCLANGFPISSLSGSEDLMTELQTAGGDVMYGGTFNAHPVSLAAANETIRQLQERNYHEAAKTKCDRICDALDDIIEDLEIRATVMQFGTSFSILFMDSEPENYRDILTAHNDDQCERFLWEMIDRGVLMVPTTMRSNYLTASHTQEDIEKTVDAAHESFEVVNDDN